LQEQRNKRPSLTPTLASLLQDNLKGADLPHSFFMRLQVRIHIQ
jgi:hypothetical protein